MKSCLLLLTFAFSFSLFATESIDQREICYSHGQCQGSNLPTEGYRTFIVKTYINPDGSQACTLRAKVVLIGSYCEPIPGYPFGLCKKESYPTPIEDCSKAIDPDDLP